MNFQDENEGIEFLINDFKNKIRRKETLIFYDIDEWIDIIDFLSIEEFLPFFLDIIIASADSPIITAIMIIAKISPSSITPPFCLR